MFLISKKEQQKLGKIYYCACDQEWASCLEYSRIMIMLLPEMFEFKWYSVSLLNRK